MSQRPEEWLCSSLSCCCSLWTRPYISLLLQGVEYSVKHIAATPPPSHLSLLLLCRSSSPGPSPGTPACQAGWREKEPGSVWPGWEERPQFLSLPLWLLQDLQDRLGFFIIARFWQTSFQQGPFHPAGLGQSLQNAPPQTQVNAALPSWGADLVLLREVGGTDNPPCRRTGSYFYLRNNSWTLAGDRQSW